MPKTSSRAFLGVAKVPSKGWHHVRVKANSVEEARVLAFDRLTQEGFDVGTVFSDNLYMINVKE